MKPEFENEFYLWITSRHIWYDVSYSTTTKFGNKLNIIELRKGTAAEEAAKLALENADCYIPGSSSDYNSVYETDGSYHFDNMMLDAISEVSSSIDSLSESISNTIRSLSGSIYALEDKLSGSNEERLIDE